MSASSASAASHLIRRMSAMLATALILGVVGVLDGAQGPATAGAEARVVAAGGDSLIWG